MASARLRVVVTRRLPAPVEARMRELFDVTPQRRRRADDRRGDRRGAMAEADVLVPTITDRIDARLLAQAGPQLRLIANYGAGFDHIDVATALQRGIMVSNTPGVLAEDTADMAMALILAVPRRLPEGAVLMQKRRLGGLEPDRAARPPHRRQAARHPRPRPHRPGDRPAGARPSGWRSTTTTAAACIPTSRRSSARPGGRASTRCWRGSTSCRSTCRTRPRPST